MNIFVVSNDPKDCANVLDDLRANKMILETAQIICTVLSETQPHLTIPYKPTHKNHPCTLWAKESSDNLAWLFSLFFHLGERFRLVKGREHKSVTTLLPVLPKDYGTLLPEAQYSKIEFIHASTKLRGKETVYKAYWNTLYSKWMADKKPPTWTYPDSFHEAIPDWMVQQFQQNNWDLE